MTLNGVFDESGDYHDCRIIVFGGLMFDAADIKDRFNRRWNTLLRGARIPLPLGPIGPYLHMTDLNNVYTRDSTDRATQVQIESLVESLKQCICDSAVGAC